MFSALVWFSLYTKSTHHRVKQSPKGTAGMSSVTYVMLCGNRDRTGNWCIHHNNAPVHSSRMIQTFYSCSLPGSLWLLGLQVTLLTSGKNSWMRIKVQGCLMQAFHWNPPGFCKTNKVGYFSNRPSKWLWFFSFSNDSNWIDRAAIVTGLCDRDWQFMGFIK